jgi:hypothetical protein
VPGTQWHWGKVAASDLFSSVSDSQIWLFCSPHVHIVVVFFALCYEAGGGGGSREYHAVRPHLSDRAFPALLKGETRYIVAMVNNARLY